VGADNNLLIKDHVHTFVNKGGDIGGELVTSKLVYRLSLEDQLQIFYVDCFSAELDFRFFTGAPLHGIKAFLTTNQLSVRKSYKLFGLILEDVMLVKTWF
jgi:zeta-carotene desaturase